MQPYVSEKIRPRGRRLRDMVAVRLVAAAVFMPIAAVQAQGDETALTGRLTQVQGVRVLHLWGSPNDRGFAHGAMLADEIMDVVENVLLDPRVMPNPQVYEMHVRQRLLKQVRLSEAPRQELAGMLAGMHAVRGADRCRLSRFDRAIDTDDLLALNTLADWNPSACSSFAVWGPGTTDGDLIVARNLDYFNLPGIHEKQLLIAHAAGADGRRGFVSVSWPGIVGVYTGMNDAGLFVAMHDAPGAKSTGAEPFVPRSFALRELLETMAAGDHVVSARRYLEATPAFRGNNFMVAGPYAKGKPPAAVFEYDANGLTMRVGGGDASGLPPHAVACTNHYRRRAEPIQCARYLGIATGLNQADAKIDPQRAFDIIAAAARNNTIHTVVVECNKKRFEVCMGKPDMPATQSPRIRFEIEKLLAR